MKKQRTFQEQQTSRESNLVNLYLHWSSFMEGGISWFGNRVLSNSRDGIDMTWTNGEFTKSNSNSSKAVSLDELNSRTFVDNSSLITPNFLRNNDSQCSILTWSSPVSSGESAFRDVEWMMRHSGLDNLWCWSDYQMSLNGKSSEGLPLGWQQSFGCWWEPGRAWCWRGERLGRQQRKQWKRKERRWSSFCWLF